MRYSETLIPTTREDSAEAEIISHKLMLRAGLIRKLSSGIYIYLPLALRIIRNIEKIIRQEMARAGAQELLMPALQPSELWKETGRWQHYGKELMRLQDRHDRDFCLGPTHEEVITDLVRKEVRSYRQLPLNFYQIQTKFRDEVRPRFGIMRGREFVMKDAYSFDADLDGAKKNYKKMFNAYNTIFNRLGLRFRPVEADTGMIGGASSHEFMVLTRTGEEGIASCTECDYAANVEQAPIVATAMASNPQPIPPLQGEARWGWGKEVTSAIDDSRSTLFAKVVTPGKKSVEEVSSFLNVGAEKLIKTLIYLADQKPVAVLVRGDHQVNEIKLKKVLNASLLVLASASVVEQVTAAPCGFSGPIGLSGVEIIGDYALLALTDMVVGANELDRHYIHLDVDRDIRMDRIADIRNLIVGDPCPRCEQPIVIDRGIEVGHVFLLGSKYSREMKAVFLNEQGEERFFEMGCYGIGVTRIMAASIEQNYDDKGIVWPMPLAPFLFHLLPVQDQSEKVRNLAEHIYQSLMDKGVDLLFDNRKERPGVKFRDADLLGVPYQIVIGEKNLAEGFVEVKERKSGQTQRIPVEQVTDHLFQLLNQYEHI
jgi:prolyl-tRNA synthetase